MSSFGTDIEMNRVEYVQQMESQLQHLRGEYERYKAIAEKWEPRATTSVDGDKQLVTVGLEFGGKRSHAQITFTALNHNDQTTVVSAIVDALIESNVAARLREAIEPEVAKLMPNVKMAVGAGKW